MFKRRWRALVAPLLAAGLLASACAGGDALEQGNGQGNGQGNAQGNGQGNGQGGSPAPKGTVVIGSTNFPEQLLLANMYAEVLRDRGVKVQTRLNIGNREVVFPALKSGELSVVPEYTGALLSYLTNGEATARKPDQVLSDLRTQLPGNVVALEPSSAEDKDALVVTHETAKKYDLRTVSDLKGVAGEMVVGGPPELKKRALGLPGYKKVYGLEFESFRALDTGPVTKSALRQGDIDAARLFTTDAAIAKNNWVVLKDDKGLVPAQNLVPVAREDALNPTVKKALNELSSKLTTDEITRLNARVSIDKEDPAKVAKHWLRQDGLIGS